MEKSDFILPPSVKDVTLRLARPDERRRWDATMAQRHYLGFQQFAGRGLRYVAEYQKCWLARSVGNRAPSSAVLATAGSAGIARAVPAVAADCQQHPPLVLTRPGAIPDWPPR